MSRKSGKPTYYEIGTGLDAPGKFSRRHIIRCSKCDASIGFRPSTLSDDQLRKKYVIEGWEVGKTQAQHLCPKHAHTEKSYARPLPIIEVHDVAPLPRITLREAWEQASEGERQGLLKHLQSECGVLRVKFPTDDKPQQNKPPIPLILNKPEEATEPDPEDIEVADIIFGKRKSA